MSQAPSMPMFWDAYLADTTHLTTEEHGAYMLLLAAMWRRNGWVPDDDRDNARILGLTPAKWRRIKARLAPFLVLENGEITQKNLLKIWKNTQEKIRKNKENGAKGGRPKSSDNNDIAKADGSVSDNPSETIPEPEPEPEEKKEPKGSKKKATRRTRIPEDAVCDDEFLRVGLEAGHDEDEVRAQFTKFRDSAIQHGRLYANWHMAFRNWFKSEFYRPIFPKHVPLDGGQNEQQHRGNTQSGGWRGDAQAEADIFAAAVRNRRPTRANRF